MSDLEKKKLGRPKKTVATAIEAVAIVPEVTTTQPVDMMVLRSADEAADAPRKTFKDIFSDFNPKDVVYTGELQVIGLHDSLHPCLVTQTPKDIEKITRLGYKPLDEVQSLLGETIDGTHQHHSGTRTKWYVCLKEHRDARHAEEKVQRDYVDKMTFREDKEQPTFGHRTTPPPGYSSDGTNGFL